MRAIPMMRTLVLCLLPAAGLAQPLAAPPPMPPPPPGHADLGKWWKSSEIAGALALTAPQVQKIEQTFLEHRLKLIDLHADLEREEVRLQPLVEADQPDEAQVGAAIDRVVAARGRLEKANTMMMLAVRRVLSLEQWHKLEAIKQERERTFEMRVPPPPGAPHPQMNDGPQGPPPPRRGGDRHEPDDRPAPGTQTGRPDPR
jgi:protein CpxP